MISDGQFSIEDLKTVYLLGAAENFPIYEEINKELGLKTVFITAPDQLHSLLKSENTKVFKSLNSEFLDWFKKEQKDNSFICISFGARWIFKDSVIQDVFQGNLVNFHAARLPFDRGAGGYSWRIMRGDRISMQLVHLVDGGLDTGYVLRKQASVIPPSVRKPVEFIHYDNQMSVPFYRDFISQLLKGEAFPLEKQNDDISFYMPRLNTDIHGFIDWNMPDSDLERFILAFDEPYAGASTFIGDKKVRIKDCQYHGGESVFSPYMRGLIVRNNKEWIVVAGANKGAFVIQTVLDEAGKNIIPLLKEGDRLHTPSEYLDTSFSERVFYGAEGLKK